MAKCLAVNHSGVAAFFAHLVVLYCRVEGLCFLQALAADRGLQVVAREKAFAALGAFQAVHFALWFPAIEQSHKPLLS